MSGCVVVLSVFKPVFNQSKDFYERSYLRYRVRTINSLDFGEQQIRTDSNPQKATGCYLTLVTVICKVIAFLFPWLLGFVSECLM